MQLWQLENILNAQGASGVSFNFLSNIRNENIRNALKGVPATASLLASVEDMPVLTEASALTTNETAFNDNFPIWANSVAQDSIQQPSRLPISTSHISTSQVDTNHISAVQVSASQVGVPQVGMIHFSTSEIGTTQVSTPEVDVIQISPFQVSTPQVSVTQESSTQLDATQINFLKVSAMQNYVGKLSLPKGITLEQFLNLNYPAGVTINTPIWHSSITEKSSFLTDGTQVSTQQVGISQVSTTQVNTSQISTPQISKTQIGFSQISIPQISTTQISSPQVGVLDVSPLQTGIAQVGSTEIGMIHYNPTQISTFKNSFFEYWVAAIIGSNKSSSQINPAKVTLPSTIPLKQLVTIHDSTPASNNTFKDNPLNFWQTLFDPSNPFDLTFQIKDLPKGQLAEAQITKFDDRGRPIGGTIEVDPTANGMGWFIDPTPLDNSEFSQTLNTTAFRATPDSAAYGHYDLLTALLHEMGHLEGFINGYNGFDHHIQTVNDSKLFVGDNFSATLTPDGSHLDSKVYPYDLMNPTLTPGVRKLPSTLDAQIITAARNNTARYVASPDALNAPLISLPLTDILNGKFDTSDDTDPNYGWTTRGAATVLSFEAVLTEDSPLNSEFKQTFTIPQGAKYLQFTLKDTTLGDDSALAPGDAIEVALLDANEKTSLVDTALGLTSTDAFLNIQHDGKAYISNKVILPATVAANTALSLHSPRTFRVDLSGIKAGTLATLYFDLLGFGKRDAKVTIDNVQLLNDLPIPPVANNDTATTDQTKPTIINVLANDTDANSTIDPLTLTIGTTPTNGIVLVNPDGTITYTPATTFVGTDTFTYTVADKSGTTSDPATVSVRVNNVAPTITSITGNTTTSEGATTNFTATATDPGDRLTYTWNFGDGTDPSIGQTANHIFADNGTYTTTLTVRDTQGVSSFHTLTVKVNNVAPTVDAGADVSIDQGKSVTFRGSFTDPGILDTHTIKWDFGDGTTLEYQPSQTVPSDYLTPTHIYTHNGTYSATLTVTDNDGAATSDTTNVKVRNVAPTITEIKGDTNFTEGALAHFTATATDNGNDPLTVFHFLKLFK